MGSYSIRFLQSWMLTYKKLNALMFEIIIHHTLIISSHSNCPLLYFTHNTLPPLLSYPRNIALCPCILHTQAISIFYPYSNYLVIKWSRRTPCKHWSRITVQIIFFTKFIIFDLFIISIFVAWNFIFLILLPNMIKYFFNRSNTYFCLCDISSI